MELEARSAQRASALRAGASVLQLKEADSPILRRSLAQLEQSWTGVSSTLPAAQEKLHQVGQESGWCSLLPLTRCPWSRPPYLGGVIHMRRF